MKPKSKIAYCIDTSALITMHRYYPASRIQGLWDQIEESFSEGVLISHSFVYDEIVPKDKKTPKDDLAQIISSYNDSFHKINDKQAKLVPKILSLFPGLIDPNSKKDQADPWLIAMCIDLLEQSKEKDEDTDYILVSMESKNSDNKIPAVCKHYKVKHMDIFEFFDANKWKLSFSKSN